MGFKDFVKDNKVLCIILVFALLIRLWFFYVSYGHPVWFDESDYLSHAKLYADNLNGNPYEINPQRPPLFPMMIAGFFMAGFGNLAEPGAILFLVLLPSLLLVFATYVLAKDMFNKNVALIAAALSSISWTYLFWSNRVQPDFLSMVLQVIAISAMWKYWNGSPAKYKYTWPIVSGAMTALAFNFKISALLVPMTFMVFILIKDRLNAFKDKGYWLYALSFILFMLPYFLWAQTTYGDPFAFKAGYIDAPTDFPEFGWYNLNFYQTLTSGGINNSNPIMFGIFVIACMAATLKILFSLDLMVKDKSLVDGKVFCLLIFIVVSCFYIFYMRNTDDRWVYLWMPFIYMMVGWILMEAYNFITKDERFGSSKIVSIIAITGLVLSIMFIQYQHTDELIKIKAPSYGPVKDAALWIKANSATDAKVLSISYPQTVYYSERNVNTYSNITSAAQFEEMLNRSGPTFIIVSLFEPHPSWTYPWTVEQTTAGNIMPVQAYFQDYAKTQPSLIVYYWNGGTLNVSKETA